MKVVLKGTLFSFVITFAVILILSLVTYFTDADSRIITVLMYAGVAVGVTAGAFVSAKGSEKAVLPHAMLVSLIYLAALIAVSAALNHTLQTNGHFITMTVGILASGFLGAVLGK